MSLHTAAQHLRSKGRFGDNMLVHMSHDEFEKLADFAEKRGVHLTVNPKTGLPEMFLLKKVLGNLFGDSFMSTILPILLGAALGPAGLGLSAMQAGLVVGGGTALATGDIKKGFTAGLGAYGGSNLGGSLSGFGSQQAATTGTTTFDKALQAAEAGSAASAGTSSAASAASAAAPELASTAAKTAAEPTMYESMTKGIGDSASGLWEAAKNPAAYEAFYAPNAAMFGLPPGSSQILAAYMMGGEKAPKNEEGSDEPFGDVEIEDYAYIPTTYSSPVGVGDTGEKIRYSGSYRKTGSRKYKPYGV